jgi:hypothetical protein
MAQKIITSQTDFSGGEPDANAKRREDAKQVKTGCRQMSNWRQLNTGSLNPRPGRTAVSLALGTRSERFRMVPTQELIITFLTGAISIADLSGNVLASNASAAYLWTNATVANISWVVAVDRVVVCFPGMQPQLILFAQTSNSFSFAPFAFKIIGFQRQQPFFRFSVPGATMAYSSPNGATTLSCSVPYFTNAMIGSFLSILGQQCLITAVGSTTPVTHATAVVDGALPEGLFIQGVNQSELFAVGQLATTGDSQFTIEINSSSGENGGSVGGILTNVVNANVVGGPYTVGLVSQLGPSNTATIGIETSNLFTVQWQEEFMSNFRGWPSACFFDRDRLGFCNFPQMPEAILWGAVDLLDVFWIDSGAASQTTAAGVAPSAAILEFISGKPHVQNVVGWTGDEFVFTDHGVFSIPINTGGNPLQPGSVQFSQISDDSACSIRPAVTRDVLVFVNAGFTKVGAVVRTGNFTTPYVTDDVTGFYTHLIKSPVWIAVAQGDGNYPERYIYVLNGDGTLAVGRYGNDKQLAGWVPWSSAGAVQWISVLGTTVLYNTLYGSQAVIELENSDFFLDQAVNINSPPPAMLAGGNGPFIAFANKTVRMMDGAIDHGDRPVSATGFLIPNVDDDMSLSTLVGGVPFTSILEPFVEQAQAGGDAMQRQRRRRLSRVIATVFNSSGFQFGGEEIPPNNFDEDATAQPILRETTYRCRPLGRDFDPRFIIIKDTPGPLTIIEVALEVTV